MLVSPADILPSQDFLKPQTLRYIATCLKNGEHDQLPPPPIVRINAQNQYVAIDGHNLIATMLVLKRPIEIVLAANAHDYAAHDTEASQKRKDELAQKFDSCLDEQERVAAAGITSFSDLVAQYSDELQT